jgi:hypothetical protein
MFCPFLTGGQAFLQTIFNRRTGIRACLFLARQECPASWFSGHISNVRPPDSRLIFCYGSLSARM